MVRMNPLNPELNEDGDEDYTTSSSYKRSRSSLDYKGDPSSDKIIPQEKLNKGFDPGAASASGSGRSSRSKSDLDDTMFAGMSSEEIIRHLYENPELAKSLGIDPTLTNPPNAGATTKKSYRTELLQKQGFPFIQWAIVLFLLGFGLYRLYKFAKPPAATVKQKVKRKGNKKIPEKSSDDFVLSKVVAEIEGAGDEDGGKESSGKNGSKKAKKKQSKKGKSKQQQSAAKSPTAKDNVDDNSVDSDAAPAPAPKSSPKKSAPASTAVPEAVLSGQEEDTAADGWHTVGSSAKPSSATNGVANQKVEPKASAPEPKPSAPAPKATATEPPVSAPKPKASATELTGSKPSNGASQKPLESAPAASVPEPQQGKKKAKKKKKSTTEAAEAAASAANGERDDVSLDDDQALALRLQEEENNLVVEEPAQPLQDDVWADVPTKKKKNKT